VRQSQRSSCWQGGAGVAPKSNTGRAACGSAPPFGNVIEITFFVLGPPQAKPHSVRFLATSCRFCPKKALIRQKAALTAFIIGSRFRKVKDKHARWSKVFVPKHANSIFLPSFAAVFRIFLLFLDVIQFNALRFTPLALKCQKPQITPQCENFLFFWLKALEKRSESCYYNAEGLKV
jgi:hypothetical protein